MLLLDNELTLGCIMVLRHLLLLLLDHSALSILDGDKATLHQMVVK